MENYIMKYLVVKMYLGYGYSATEEEINESLEYLGITADKSYDEKHIAKKDNIYYALYSLDKHIIPIESIENFNSISKYIVGNLDKPLLNGDVDEDNLSRASNLSIYIINALNNIESTDLLLEEFEEKEFYKDYSGLFKKLSYLIANQLVSSKTDADDEVILEVVNVNPKTILSSYKAYCNYRIIDDNLDNVLSESFKDYKFAMVFGTNKYYGMSSYEHDYCVVVDDKSIYGPIYIIAAKQTDPIIQECRVDDEEEAKELIGKMLSFSKKTSQ